MKLLLVGLFLVVLACSLPEIDQMLLANSMVVGRENENDLVNWECNVCAPVNKPLHAHYIEEK